MVRAEPAGLGGLLALVKRAHLDGQADLARIWSAPVLAAYRVGLPGIAPIVRAVVQGCARGATRRSLPHLLPRDTALGDVGGERRGV